MMKLIEEALRVIFMAIDGLLGWAVSTLYTLIVQIANVDVFGDYIWEFAGRIYTFLAIFMLFKLSISMVNYILNPDQFSDKSKGFGKLIQNVIIVIVLIITVPNIFNWAYDLQSMILNSNVLYTVVTGKKNDNNFDLDEWRGMDDKEKVRAIKNSASNAGNQLKYEIMSTFIYYKNECSVDIGADNYDEECSKEVSARRKTGDKSCYAVGQEYATGGNKISYTAAYDCLMSAETINNTSEKKHGLINKGFTNEYKWFISTLCMGVVAYVFLTFSFDVALRSVKLGVLQLMAPIPIISRLDPNSGKSGMFSKWLKECTTTYLDLFIRLLGLFFAIEIITSMTEPGRFFWRGTNESVGFGFVKIFIILGLLMFAKQLPQFIKNITGIDLSAGGGLNLGKKLGSVPGAKAVGTLGRKTVAGIDAKRNGQSFRDGWRKIEGTGPIAKFQKWRDGMMPYSAQTRKNRREGSEEISAIDSKWNKGKQTADKFGRNWKDAFDGRTTDNYKKAFDSEAFINSKMNLDLADDELKNMRRRNTAAQANGTLTEGMVKQLEDQEKKVSGLQKVHDSMRKMYGKDAATEDAYKFYKGNETNPANLSQNQTRYP